MTARSRGVASWGLVGALRRERRVLGFRNSFY